MRPYRFVVQVLTSLAVVLCITSTTAVSSAGMAVGPTQRQTRVAPATRALFTQFEYGRAADLVQRLRNASALDAAGSPPVRFPEEERAAAAFNQYWRARRGGSLRTVRPALGELQVARTALQEKLAQVLRWPGGARGETLAAPSLTRLQALLGARDAFVTFGALDERYLAVVTTRRDVLTRSLGSLKSLKRLLGALRLDDPERGPEDAVAHLRKILVARLGLDAEARRVLVSPDRLACTLPLGLLFEGRETAFVPSASAFIALCERCTLRGLGVVAVGDPAYHGRGAGIQGAARLYGPVLSPLAATRREARAVGDYVLLGSEATEEGLVRTIASRPRWRAVHLAGHGLRDTKWPLFSAFALTPTRESDGMLTVHEVLRMRVHADLVALSACETALGQQARSGQVHGLTPAFLAAGAQRVLSSLWRVEDEATRVLMERFYALWNPRAQPGDLVRGQPGRVAGAGGRGIGAAAALEQAQAFVRSHPRWRHPYYWAGWTLWGLPS